MSVLCVFFVSSVIPEEDDDDEVATELEGLLLVALPWFMDSLVILNDDGEGDGLDVEYGFFFFCIGIIASSSVSVASCCGVVIVCWIVTSVAIIVSLSIEEDTASLCRNRTSVMPIRITRPARNALMNDHRTSKNRMLLLLLTYKREEVNDWERRLWKNTFER